MPKIISKLALFFIGAYIFFNFLQFKGGKNIPQLKTFEKVSKIVQKDSNLTIDSPILQSNYIEKTLTNIFLNILESKEGSQFIQNINLPNNQSDAYLSYVNKEPINLTKTLKDGNGQVAICNDNIHFTYEIYNKDHILVKEAEVKSLIINDKLNQKMRLLLDNKKPQQQFEMHIYEADNNNFEIYKVNINDIKYNIDNSKSSNIFKKEFPSIIGNGRKIFCNELVKLKFILETNPLKLPIIHEMTTLIGSNDLPREITEMILGKRIGSKISFLTDAKLLNLISSQNKKIFNIDSKNHNFAILNIELLNEK